MKSLIIKNFKYSKNLKHLIDININHDLSSTLIFKDIEDKYNRMNIAEELSLRSFTFEQDKKVFDFESFNGEYIFSEEDEGNYKKIRFKSLRLIDLVFKYTVNDDRFFNYIPLKNILENGLNVNYEDIKNHLIECGFGIKEKLPETEMIEGDSFLNVSEPFIKYKIGSEIDIDSINPQILYEMMYSSKEKKTSNNSGELIKDFNKNLKLTRTVSRSIEMLPDFYFLNLPNEVIENEETDIKLLNLINHLKRNDIFLFSEITKDFVIQFSKTPGVGTGKIIQLLTIVENIRNEGQESNSHKLEDKNYNKSKKEIEVRFCELYYDPKYNHLKNHYLSYDLIKGNFDIAFLNIMADVISVHKQIQDFNLADHITLLQNYELFIKQSYRLQSNKISGSILKSHYLIDNETNTRDTLFNIIKDFKKFEGFLENNPNFNFNEKIDERETMTLAELLETFVVKQKPESMSIYLERQKGFTLESIARKINITRERVRQIEAKINQRLLKFYELNRSYIMSKLNTIGKHYQTSFLRDDYFDLQENMIFILKGMIKKFDSKMFSKYLDIIILNLDFDDTFDDFIDNIDSSYLSFETLYLMLKDSFFELGFENPNRDDLIRILDYKKIKYDEINVFFDRVTKSDKYVEVIKLYEGQVNLVDEFEDFSVKFYNLFNERLSNNENSIRSIAARLYDSSQIYLTGTNTFIHIDKIRYSKEQIDFLMKEIESALNLKSRVKISELYKDNRDNFELNGFFNEYVSYSVAKVYGSAMYEFGKGNTMMISKSKEDLQKDYHDEIYQLVVGAEGSLQQSVVIDYTGIFFANLDAIIEQKNMMIRISSTVYAIEKLKRYKEEFEFIKTITNELISRDDITTIGEVFERCLFNTKIYSMFQEMGISESGAFYSLLRYLTPEYANGISSILKSDNQVNNDVWLYFSSKVKRFTVDYLVEFLLGKGLSRVTVDAKRKELSIRNEFIRVDFDSYAINELIGVNEQVLDKLIDYVSEKFTKEYIVVNDLFDYSRALPSINVSWTPYLIHELLKRQGFKSIEKKRTTTIDRLIIVKQNSKIQTFEELVYYVLTQRPKEENSNLLSYIKTSQILPPSVDTLPKEISEYEWLIINGTGEYYIDHEKFKERSI